MNIKPQWDDAAEPWRDFVRTGKDYYRDELNNPAMFELLGDICRKKILDLACGEGYNCRIMAKKGASVYGVDFSERMIDLAVQEEEKEKLGIMYSVLDAGNLHVLEKDAFDIVTCFMALQDIENYKDAINEVYRVLKKGGHFIFVMPHPCFEKRILNGEIIGGWEFKGEPSMENALYYKVDKYFDTHEYTISWNMERLRYTFITTAFHRTLTDYADALSGAGFLISRLKEPTPPEKGYVEYHIEDTLRIPQSIIIEAVKL
jgi:ubiquinone/menaquinone biosynthesis C-methylase UbiE